MSFSKILILLTLTCYLEQRERSDKVLISYKIPHIRLVQDDTTKLVTVEYTKLRGKNEHTH